MTPRLILTRPEAQARDFLAALGDDRPAVLSPVLEIVATGLTPDLAPYAGLILTSANAVHHAPDLTGQLVYCVGARTAQAATAAGAEVSLVARDADDLVARLTAPGPLLHLRGKHTRGDVANRLGLAGIETDEAVIYDQEPRPLSAQVVALIEGDAPAVLPLFSPRSASLVRAAVQRIGPRVIVVAISPATAAAWGADVGASLRLCAAPTGEEMRAEVLRALRG